MKILFVSALLTWLMINPASISGPVNGRSWVLPLDEKTGMPLCWIPAGTFVMGSPETENGRHADEGPQRKVTLTNGYWLGKTEVTIRQWKAITGMNVRDKALKLLSDTTHYDFGGKKMRLRDFMGFNKDSVDKILANEDLDLPMYFVSWNEAMAYCKKLTDKERAAHRLPAGYAYTLPTEAQWEYACRAGTTGPMYDEPTDKLAWFVQDSYQTYKGRGFGDPTVGPRIVGGKEANKWELQDMLGNIWEWCGDWYGPYAAGDQTDPLGPTTGINKVNRGGTFRSGINDERSANRAQNPPNEASAYRGFRVALSKVLQDTNVK